jgi:uncharacterized protein YbjT (DUF2867 family)
MKILVTGASGFIGKKLVQYLLDNNMSVRIMSRRLESLDEFEHKNLEKVKADAQKYEEVRDALKGIDIAYYLIHSMEGESKDWKKFAEIDKKVAKNFADASTECGVKRIIYVGGLVSIPDSEMSKHMSSRKEVGEILKSSEAKTTVFRASVILGKGGGGFEMMRYLVERLPVMVCPKWVLTKLQPIYIDDVVKYLYESLNVKETENRTFDIGGPDILEYREMMKAYGKMNNKSIIMIIIPFLSLRFTAYWVDLVTPIKASLSRPLVEGLKNQSIMTEKSIMDLIPIKLKGVEESLKLSIYEDDKHEFTKKENYLSYLVMALGIIGILHFLVDQRLMMMLPIAGTVSVIWLVIIGVGYYFIKQRARLGSLLVGIAGWSAALFWLVDSTHLISYLPQIGPYPVSKGISILGNYPSVNTSILNIIGLCVIAVLLVVAHFTFYDKELYTKQL